jgi:hypothetical protein
MEIQRVKTLEAIQNLECGYYYEAEQGNFEKIPGMPIAYWARGALFQVFEHGKISNFGEAKVGIGSGNTDYFLKLWPEVCFNKISFNRTNGDIKHINWVPINKGGYYRKWYGNNEYVINWRDDGYELKNYRGQQNRKLSYPRNLEYQLKESLTWGDITSGGFSMRYSSGGFFFSDIGNSLFVTNRKRIFYILGYCNSNVFLLLTRFINPTIHFKPGNMLSMPVQIIENKNLIETVDLKVRENISISKTDWDSFETSWDFKIHPLLNKEFNFMYLDLDTGQPSKTIESAYDIWKQFANNNFNQLKSNEEELNRIFIEIYGLEDELTPEVSDKDITITKIFDTREEIYEDIKGNRYILTKEDVIKSFISYAVGCMFGRYSLDKEGLAYAGGKFCDKWKIENGEWKIKDKDSWVKSSINIAEDNIIFITDEEYFEDDIVNRFVDFVKTVYGEEPLEENLNFIADALGGRGTPKEIIRNYFLRDFYKDHIKTYQKRPIYWQYDSGKQNGFKAIIYMHRYDEDTTGRVRVDYLHKMQKAYEIAVDNFKYTIANNKNPREVAKAEKHLTKITKQLKECKDYDEKIAHLAIARIPIDLDDGVKVNYDKIQTDEKGKNLRILTKV